MKIAIGSDHGGFDIKEMVKEWLTRRGIEVEDVGCYSKQSVDYPDYAREVAYRVSHNTVDQGVLVCTTGLGMAIAANKFPRVRATVCLNPDMAMHARLHNDANVLALAGKYTSMDDAKAILKEWLDRSFEKEERHERRVRKINRFSYQVMEIAGVFEEDPEVYAAIQEEMDRQQDTINLIASENFVSRAVKETQGCVMTNKYAEGYPGMRWYRGCENVDIVERLAIDRAKKLFGAEHANVQVHCGSTANMAVYFAMLDPGDTVLAMSLAHGGHLTHGSKASFSGRLFNFVSYGVSPETEQIDYDDVAKLAEEHKPKMIVAGASAYPRVLDFKRFREIADNVGAMLLVDMAHIAGLIAAECHPNPVPYADFVTTTTHKTLAGSRGGMILCKKEYAKAIDQQVFPGLQGGPMMHAVAAKAVTLHEALKPEFKEYGRQIIKNAQVLAREFLGQGLRLVSGGTDNHLMLIDLAPLDITGHNVAVALERAGIIVNKNAIPFDKKNPLVTSGIRVGLPMVTTLGMKESEMVTIAGMVGEVLQNINNEALIKNVRARVEELAVKFPVP